MDYPEAPILEREGYRRAQDRLQRVRGRVPGGYVGQHFEADWNALGGKKPGKAAQKEDGEQYGCTPETQYSLLALPSPNNKYNHSYYTSKKLGLVLLLSGPSLILAS